VSVIYEPREVVLSLVELEALCAEWQQVLRIQDWRVELEILAEEQMHAWGDTAMTHNTQYAHIRIAHPCTCDQTLIPCDMELALVHELVHVRFGIAAKRTEFLHVEHAVSAMAEALLGMKRAAKG
jgi:hypothetical protein